MNKGFLRKEENQWIITCVEDGDWNTYYPLNEIHNFWLQIWGEEGKEMNFELNDGIATLKPSEIDTHEYTQD